MEREVFEPLGEINTQRTKPLLIGFVVSFLFVLAWTNSSSELLAQQAARVTSVSVVGDSQADKGRYPGYPECRARVDWLRNNWNATAANYKLYAAGGVDGSINSFLAYLNQHGLYCPTANDANKEMIRGVSLGGWLVLEPWIMPSLFQQFTHLGGLHVEDQWTFCQVPFFVFSV